VSAQADQALDLLDAWAGEPPPTKDEEHLVNCFRLGTLPLPKLWHKLGLRASYVCAHFGITTREAAPLPPPPTLAERLAAVTTTELEDELARRRREATALEEPW
jgi:hypothetical protein